MADGLHGQEADLSTSLLHHTIQTMDNAIMPKVHGLPAHFMGNWDGPYTQENVRIIGEILGRV